MSRILVIEDDAAIREMLVRRLQLRGYTVEQAVDGESGLAMIRAAPPDVVLLDHGLPGMSGWDVARALRADPAFATLPVIALTAHAGEPSRRESLLAGCSSFHVKPVDMKALEKDLLRLLDRGAAT
jgi:two-component system cell cycle response regulator DivK